MWCVEKAVNHETVGLWSEGRASICSCQEPKVKAGRTGELLLPRKKALWAVVSASLAVYYLICTRILRAWNCHLHLRVKEAEALKAYSQLGS